MYTALLGHSEDPRPWMECASRCSYLTSRSSETLTESGFADRRLGRGTISSLASRPGSSFQLRRRRWSADVGIAKRFPSPGVLSRRYLQAGQMVLTATNGGP